MPTVGQVLPPETLDEIVQRVAPAEATNKELTQFKHYLSQMDTKQVRGLEADLLSAARVRGRKIILREQLLGRLATDWLRKQHEIVEGELAKLEVGKDIHDLNLMELELARDSWSIGRTSKVLRLDEQAASDPLINMIKHRELENENDILNADGGVDDDRLEKMFGGNS